MVVALECLAVNSALKLQVLASSVAEGPVSDWQLESVDKGVLGHFVFGQETDGDRLVELVKVAAVFHDYRLSVLPNRDQRVDRLCFKLTKKASLLREAGVRLSSLLNILILMALLKNIFSQVF